MQKINRLLALMNRDTVAHTKEQEMEKIIARLSTDQLKELLYNEPTEERIKNIFASLGGLHILESW